MKNRLKWIVPLCLLAVLVLVLGECLMAYELIRDSVGKIVHPEETEFSGLIVVILATCAVSVWLGLRNEKE